MEYRLNKELLFSTLMHWDSFLKRKVHFVVCGGTAMTLLGIKESTRDIDFMVPVLEEYAYVIGTIKQLGYQNQSGYGWARPGDAFIFDLFPGKKIHTTELLDDPLKKEKHSVVREFSQIYLGVLNDYDLIASKLFMGTTVDFEDSLHLASAHRRTLDREKLKEHFFELLAYHSVGESRVRSNWDSFERRLKELK